MGVSAFVSCSNDDGEEWVGTANETTESLVGTWYCTSQQWAGQGESETAAYAPSPAYAVTFNATFTGKMASGEDDLFEIKTDRSFMWYVVDKDGKPHVVTSLYEGDEYQILKLTGHELVMRWNDDGYSITCRFERAD